MDYSTIANSIKEKAESMSLAANNINKSSFDSIWKGSAHDTLTSDLSKSISRINKQKSAANKFATALEKIEKYKENKKQIEELYSQLNSIVDDAEGKNARSNAIARRRIKDRIYNYKYLNGNLKSSINGLLNSITSVSSELEVINYDINSGAEYKEFVVDIGEFLTKFNTGDLKTFGSSANSSSIYDYYSHEEINNRIDEIKTQYTGRDAAVNCVLGVMEMAASVGGKLDLNWNSPSESNVDDVAVGSTYNSLASWAVNQGANTVVSSGKIIGEGQNTTYEQAQKGDVLVSDTGSMIMILDNDLEQQEFLIVDTTNPEDGAIVQAKSYASLTGNYQAIDLSSIYND